MCKHSLGEEKGYGVGMTSILICCNELDVGHFVMSSLVTALVWQLVCFFSRAFSDDIPIGDLMRPAPWMLPEHWAEFKSFAD